jgi:hypothetical protein
MYVHLSRCSSDLQANFSSISSFLQRIDALRWTPHMDECLQRLAEKQECPTDEILVQQVRLQLIVEKVAQAPWYDGEVENVEPIRAPPAFYLKALQSQLLEVKRKLPPESLRNGKLSFASRFHTRFDGLAEVVLAHIYSTELTINEIALSKAPIISNNSDFQRLESLYACLNSVKSWFDVFFTIPPSAYIAFSFSVFSQLVHCLVALFRLSTLDDPAWDKDIVRNTANLLLILDQVADNIGQAARLAGLDSDSTERDIFTKAAKMVESVRLGWEASQAVQPVEPAIPTRPNVDETISDAFQLDLSDDAWLTEILVSLDC